MQGQTQAACQQKKIGLLFFVFANLFLLLFFSPTLVVSQKLHTCIWLSFENLLFVIKKVSLNYINWPAFLQERNKTLISYVCMYSRVNVLKINYSRLRFIAENMNLKGKDRQRQLLYYVNLIRACKKVLYQLVYIGKKNCIP